MRPTIGKAKNRRLKRFHEIHSRLETKAERKWYVQKIEYPRLCKEADLEEAIMRRGGWTTDEIIEYAITHSNEKLENIEKALEFQRMWNREKENPQ